jgi:hypothetical protein
MEARMGNGAQSLPADSVPRRHKDADSGTEQAFEILASIGYPLCQMSTTGELQSTIWLIVMITVEHYFKAPRGDTRTEVVDERLILVQRMHRPPSSEFVWHCFTCPRTMKRDHSKRDRTPLTHLTVHPLQIFRRGEEAGVIVANAKIHANLLRSPMPTSPSAVLPSSLADVSL